MSRIILSPVFFLLYFFPVWTERGSAVSVFIMIPVLAFAEFTDFLDGFYARKYRQVSDFGKLFDPFGDVILHLTAFSCLTFSGYMPPWAFMLILYREFTMLFIRLMAIQKGVAIAARKGGKSKTVLYIVTVFYSLFLVCAARLGLALPSVSWEIAAQILYIICVFAAYFSFIEYMIHFKALWTSSVEDTDLRRNK